MKYDCVIIGAGPAGLTAGLYLRRAGYNVAVVTGYSGSMSTIARIDNYPGVIGKSGQDILDIMMTQCNDISVEFIQSEVVCINVNDDNTFNLQLDDDSIIESISIIDASGGKHKTLGIDGEEKWINDGISFCATCDGPMYVNKDVIVVGGGNSAISSAIELAKYCSNVHIVYRRNEFSKVEKALLEEAHINENIKYHMNANVKSFLGKDELLGVELDNDDIIYASAVFYCIGFDYTGIQINGDISNSLYFTSGDKNNKFKQAIIAAGDGASTALELIEKLKIYK